MGTALGARLLPVMSMAFHGAPWDLCRGVLWKSIAVDCNIIPNIYSYILYTVDGVENPLVSMAIPWIIAAESFLGYPLKSRSFNWPTLYKKEKEFELTH